MSSLSRLRKSFSWWYHYHSSLINLCLRAVKVLNRKEYFYSWNQSLSKCLNSSSSLIKFRTSFKKLRKRYLTERSSKIWKEIISRLVIQSRSLQKKVSLSCQFLPPRTSPFAIMYSKRKLLFQTRHRFSSMPSPIPSTWFLSRKTSMKSHWEWEQEGYLVNSL